MHKACTEHQLDVVALPCVSSIACSASNGHFVRTRCYAAFIGPFQKKRIGSISDAFKAAVGLGIRCTPRVEAIRRASTLRFCQASSMLIATNLEPFLLALERPGVV